LLSQFSFIIIKKYNFDLSCVADFFQTNEGITMGQTFVEKVFSKKLGRKVRAGDIIEVIPDVAMSHDNTAAISILMFAMVIRASIERLVIESP